MAYTKGLCYLCQNMMLALVSTIIISIEIGCKSQKINETVHGIITTPVTLSFDDYKEDSFKTIVKDTETIIYFTNPGIIVIPGYTDKLNTPSVTNSTLSFTILNATRGDAGNYSLFNTDFTTPKLLFLVQLYIMGKPETPVTIIESNGTVGGGVGKITCETVTTSMPSGYEFSYIWKNKDGLIETNSDKYTFEGKNRKILAIKVDRNEMENVYRCYATELYGLKSDISSASTLYPFRSPLVKMEPASPVYQEIEFNYVSFNCCVTDGKPTTYTYHWWKHGIDSDEDSPVFSIYNVSRSDTGQYNCSVENGIGPSGKAETKLDILYGPEITSNKLFAQEDGHSLTVSCTVDANPKPTDDDMKWVRPNNSTFNNTGLQLAILRLNRKDNGTFICNVRTTLQSSNGVTVVKSASGAVQINVLYGPTIIPIANQSVEEGTAASIYCNILSNPSAKNGDIIWTKQENSSFSQSGSTLNISNINRLDKGTFVCSVNITLKPTNGLEFIRSAHRNVEIDVLYGPMITKMTTYSQEEGKNVTINCEIQSNPIATTNDVRWSKEGNSSFNQTGLQLYIPFVKKHDKGNFVCHVSIKFQLTNGTIVVGSNDETVKINVLYGPVIDPLSNQSLEEGDNITVNCNVKSNPMVSNDNVSWRKQGNFSFIQNGTQLYIPYADRLDNGIFICSAEIKLKPTDGQLVLHNTTETVQISVKYQPNITHLLLTTEDVLEGNDTIAICQADGNPLPTIVWLYLENNTEITSNSLTHIKWNNVSSEVKINSARCEDTGTYMCQAKNGIVSPTNKTVRLNVKCKPRLSIKVNEGKNITVSRNESLEYTAMFHAFPIPTFRWTFNKTKLVGFNITKIIDRLPYRSGSKIQKAEITDDDIGLYEVIADNTAGQSTASFYIIFQREPDQPIMLTPSCMDRPRSAKIEWIAGKNGGLEQHFIIQYKTQTDENFINAEKEISENDAHEVYSEYIDSLMPGLTYIFRVKALNAKGGSVSIEVNCTVVDINKSKTTSAITMIIVVVSIFCVLTLLGGVGGVYLVRRRTATKKKHKQLIERPSTNNRDDTAEDELTENPLYVSSEPIATENENGVIYSVVEKKKQKVQSDGIMINSEPSVYAEVVKSKTKGNGNTTSIKPKKKRNTGEKSDKSIEMGYVNENSGDMNNTKEDNVYANANNSNQITAREKQQPTKNKDGLIYADLDLAIEPNGSRFVIRGLENRNNYAVIDLTKTAEPLPSESGSEDEDTPIKKKTE